MSSGDGKPESAASASSTVTLTASAPETTPIATTTTTKRPLEDPSSPTAPNEPDAKRPALDKGGPVKGEPNDAPAESKPEADGDTKVPDAPQAVTSSIQPVDESNWIHVRAIITSAEAATVIGKGGENVTQIRRLAEAKCTVSEYSRGAVERILTVSGGVDAVAKAFGLIVRTINGELLTSPSTQTSKTFPLRLLIPHILIGSIIGKGERFGGPAASAYASRSGGPAGAIPGGMQVVPYTPQPVYGTYGHPDNYRRHNNQAQRTPANPYGIPYLHGQAPVPQPAAPIHYADPNAQPAYSGAGPHQPSVPHHAAHSGPSGQPHNNMAAIIPGAPLTQQIYIPNDMVGAIIGKGGAKINEIRQLSGSVIKINEPQDNSNERLVTITGTQECNQMALYMLYSRLESEKHRI
ncbi:hypothetical protein DRE_03999 [Drechslerella stenobrocha 248]|uniref:K Homology domain-containing protein n=1 Tax=Drechslerella stenobrocha 248 TaxID=1043628 RepID=W7HTL5_9PEZI|nr:hypothetical protein DRE_03999 [Drechslerella stenobrocha 248]